MSVRLGQIDDVHVSLLTTPQDGRQGVQLLGPGMQRIELSEEGVAKLSDLLEAVQAGWSLNTWNEGLGRAATH